MALSASTVWEVRTGGNDTNSGGFVTGSSGTDWSQQNSAQYATTDAVANGTTTITSASANFGTDVVGNIMYLAGGSGSLTAVWRQITARTNSTTITVDATVATGTGITMNIGGALASPGQGSANLSVNGMIAWVKSGTYNMTTATTNVSGGAVAFTSACLMEGYQNSRGDRTGVRPILSWASVSAPGSQTPIYSPSAIPATSLRNMGADGNNVSNVSGFSLDDDTESCLAQNCSGSGQLGFYTAGARHVTGCGAINCDTGFSGNNLLAYRCTANGGNYGFKVGMAVDCLAYSNGYGFATANVGINESFLFNCTADNNTHDGFTEQTTAAGAQYKMCIATNNGGFGFNIDFDYRSSFTSCVGFNNGSGTFAGGVKIMCNEGQITLTASPYVNSATNDYRLNTGGGGTALMGKALVVYGQTDNRDVSAVQHSIGPPSFQAITPLGLIKLS